MKEIRRLKKGGWRKHLIGGCVTLQCLLVIVHRVNFAEVLVSLKHFQWCYLIFGIISLSFGYSLRIMRWSMMLRATGVSVTFRNCISPFLGSITLNNVLPLRLGDVVRALVFPMAMGITKTTATSSLVVERLIDLMTLLASLAIGLFAVQAVNVPVAIIKSAVYLAIIGAIALTLGFLYSGNLSLFFNRLANTTDNSATNIRLLHVYSTLSGLLHSFESMSRPRVLLTMLLVSMLVWAGESGLFYFVLLGLGIDASPAIALLVMSVATLSTLAPSSPGYVGPFHLAAFTAISLVGGTTAQAGSYAVLVHLALWLPTTSAGAIAIWSRPELFHETREQQI